MLRHGAGWEQGQELANLLQSFIGPLEVWLDRQVDRRLVRTLFLALVAIVRLRHSRSGLLLSELGAHILSPAQAPTGTKRLSNLLRSPKWSHILGKVRNRLEEQGRLAWPLLLTGGVSVRSSRISLGVSCIWLCGRHALVDQPGPSEPAAGTDRIPPLPVRRKLAEKGGTRLRPGICRGSLARGTGGTPSPIHHALAHPLPPGRRERRASRWHITRDQPRQYRKTGIVNPVWFRGRLVGPTNPSSLPMKRWWPMPAAGRWRCAGPARRIWHGEPAALVLGKSA